MGDDVWFPPNGAAIESGEEGPPAPGGTMLMGDEVLQGKSLEHFEPAALHFEMLSECDKVLIE